MKTSNPRRRLAAVAVASTMLAGVLTPITIASTAHAAVGSYDNASLADKALTYYHVDSNGIAVGQGTAACADAHQSGGDQCKQFANCIVYMVSGGTQWPVDPGLNYQRSYTDAGGVAVTAANAVKGDIIQQGTYDTTDAMHTAIVINNNHDGSFQVVDANYVARGIVGDHRWVPPTSNVGFYRMGTVSSSGSIPTLNATLSGIAPNQTVSGNISLNTTISPSGYVSYLNYVVTGPITFAIRAGSGASNYPASLDTTGLPNGTYTIKAEAYETDNNNHDYATRSFTVNNSTSAPVPPPADQKVQLFGETTADLGNASADYTAGNWGSFQSVIGAIGGTPGPIGSITSAYTSNNQVHLIANSNGHLYIADGNYSSGHWSSWMDVEAPGAAGTLGAVDQEAVASIGNKLYVLALVNGQVFETSADYTAGVWAPWQNVSLYTGVSGSNFSKIAVATTGNTLHVYALNSDGNIYSADGNYSTGQWSGWSNINVSGVAGALPAAPTQLVATSLGNTVQILALVNGQIYQASPDYGAGNWSAFANLSAATGVGGSNFSSITAAATGTSLHVFAVNSDGNIYSADGNYGGSPGWSGWSNVSRSGGAGTMTGTMTNIAAASIN